VEHQFELKGEWLRGNGEVSVGCTGRVAESDLWSEIWMYT